MDHHRRVKGISSRGHLGASVRELRRRAGLTQQQLAEAAGVSRPCVSDLERAARTVRVSSLLKVVDALGYEVDLHPVPERHEGLDLDAYVASFVDS